MKKTTYTAAIISIALFSSASFAGFDNDSDVLTGGARVVATPAEPYVTPESGPNGTETDVLSNLDEIRTDGRVSPYERVGGDRDNSDDLIDKIS